MCVAVKNVMSSRQLKYISSKIISAYLQHALTFIVDLETVIDILHLFTLNANLSCIKQASEFKNRSNVVHSCKTSNCSHIFWCRGLKSRVRHSVL